VSEWQVVFLGVMAVALVAMAAAQVMISVALMRATRQLSATVQSIQRDLGPLIDKAHRMTDDAARVAALAVTQLERVDRLVSSLSTRIEQTVATVQDAVVSPLKQGATMIAALRAVVSVIREWQGRRAAPREDEDPLFVG
jgi:hypothetical protein